MVRFIKKKEDRIYEKKSIEAFLLTLGVALNSQSSTALAIDTNKDEDAVKIFELNGNDQTDAYPDCNNGCNNVSC
jgi:hypothetical protein